MKVINSTLCYVHQNDKTLMLHRIKKEGDLHKGKWNGLGGKFEKGESPEECLVREIQEESGIILTKYKLAGLLTFPNFDGENDWQVFLYRGFEFFGKLKDSEEGKLAWIDTDKILNMNLWEGDKLFIKWMLAGKFFSAKFTYVDKKLKDYTVTYY